MKSNHGSWLSATLVALYLLTTAAVAAPAAPTAVLIRANLKQRLANLPKIDEVNTTAMAGLYEVRIDQQVFYTDAQGDFLVRGELIDTRTLRNLTQERTNQLSAIDFAKLPLQDAMVWKSGTGARKVAVFADPNCGYCKKLEQELQKVKDIAVYTFILPILGEDSVQKSQAIWCSKDAVQTWRSWMLQGTVPEKAQAPCNNPLERNGKLAQSLRINGTPAMFFEDGMRSPGLMSSKQIDGKLRGLPTQANATCQVPAGYKHAS